MRTIYLSSTASTWTVDTNSTLVAFVVQGSGGVATELTTAAGAGSLNPIFRFSAALLAIVQLSGLSIALSQGEVVRLFNGGSAVIYIK